MSENADLLLAAIALFGLGWIGADNWHAMREADAREWRVIEARVASGADVWCGYTREQLRAACDKPQWLRANEQSWYVKGGK